MTHIHKELHKFQKHHNVGYTTLALLLLLAIQNNLLVAYGFFQGM